MNRRAWVVVAAGVVALATTVGTGAVSSISAERGMTVEVADDDDAYLGIDIETNTMEDGTAVNVTVSNQFPSGTTLDVTVSHEGVTLYPGDHSLESGETRWATFEKATCGETIRITANADGVTVELEREVGC
jgi:hypothetical protein